MNTQGVNNGSNGNNLNSAFKEIGKFIVDIIDLKNGVVKSETVKEIREKMIMSGANTWMLMCSIVIASIGLNLNSQAVIIGAMLISPLMSPILGIGLSVGINDQQMLKKALIHFGIAILIALITSTLYFYFSPFSEMGPEIESRTKPTFLDIIIAFFGGLAGIISIARKDISTTIPGVAIATALMPPLCVTGFGIANGHWQIASSSFYLFFLNTFFVSLATWLIIRYLNFPYKQYLTKQARRKGRLYILLFALIVVIPSFIIFKNVFKEYQDKVRIQTFINDYIGDDIIYLDDHIYIDDQSPKRLVLKVYGDVINENGIPHYKRGLENLGLKDIKIEIISTAEIELEKLKLLETEISGIRGIADRLELVRDEQSKSQNKIFSLEKELKGYRRDSLTNHSLSKELSNLFPELISFSIGKMQHSTSRGVQKDENVLIAEWSETTEKTSEKLRTFVQQRLLLDTLIYIQR